MEKNIKYLKTSIFAVGKEVKIDEEGYTQLPISNKAEKKALFVETEGGYRLITLEADVKRVYIEVTTKCNFSCITCIRNSWQDEILDMEWETFEKIIESLKGLPYLESVHFGGFGEPMTHPRIFDMIRAVKELGLKVEMITNGSFLKEENIHKLIDLELDVIFTSLDSSEEVEYKEIRKGADFNSVTNNISNLQAIKKRRRQKKPELGIEFVAMKRNFQSLPKLITMACELNASQIIVSNLLPYHESMKDEIVYDIDDTDCIFGYQSLLTTVRARMSSMRLRTERSCNFVKNKTLAINYLGYVSPCYALMHSYECYIYGREKQIYPCYIGNVKEKEIRDIWLDSGYVNFRRAVNENLFPSCTDCKSQEGCNYTESNEMDCWGNSPSCAECLWARRIIACP